MKMIIPFLIAVAVVVTAVLAWRHVKKSKEQTDWPPEVVAKVKADREAREKVRAANPDLFRALTEALFRSDPMGINFESNTDEYEAEVGTILPRLPTCKSEEDALTVVHEEFCRWFDAKTAGPRDRYRKVSQIVWQLWTNQPQQHFRGDVSTRATK